MSAARSNCFLTTDSEASAYETASAEPAAQFVEEKVRRDVVIALSPRNDIECSIEDATPPTQTKKIPAFSKHKRKCRNIRSNDQATLRARVFRISRTPSLSTRHATHRQDSTSTYPRCSAMASKCSSGDTYVAQTASNADRSKEVGRQVDRLVGNRHRIALGIQSPDLDAVLPQSAAGFVSLRGCSASSAA